MIHQISILACALSATFRLSFQWGMSKVKVFFILDLSRTLNLGRSAGVGYASERMGDNLTDTFSKSKIALAKSYQLATPSLL